MATAEVNACECETDLTENLRVSQNHNAILGTRERDVQPTWVIKEADSLMLVAPHAAENDVVLLSALERVDAGDFYLLVKVLLEGAIELHIVDNVRALALIWRDDADLVRDDPRLEELGHDLLDVRRLGPVYTTVNTINSTSEGSCRTC